MDDTNIEILETESVVTESSVVALPMNFVSVGTVEHDSVQVYIKQDVYKRVLVVATGALLNPIMIQQKESIPCVAHGILLEKVR